MVRYLIGIDLGTTNSALAYVDLQRAPHRGATARVDVKPFPVPQLVAPGDVQERPLLPSFLYLPGPHDLPAGAVALPWDPARSSVVGEFARNHGGKVPGRLVSSAKSWLCHPGVDRSAGLLPWSAVNADAGIVACMQRWVAQRGNLDTAGEFVRAASQIELDLVARLNDRFICIRKTAKGWTPATEADAIKQQTPELFDGYAKPDRILVRPEAWRRYANGVDPSEVARHFHERGILIADDNGISRTEQVIGTIGRFYVLSRAALTPLTPNTTFGDA